MASLCNASCTSHGMVINGVMQRRKSSMFIYMSPKEQLHGLKIPRHRAQKEAMVPHQVNVPRSWHNWEMFPLLLINAFSPDTRKRKSLSIKHKGKEEVPTLALQDSQRARD